ncbi:MAG: phosphate signaling complex protein PhoU [Lachnospiraceae bacterium]
MRSRFDKELSELNNELVNMGTLIEQAIQNAVDALVNQNVEEARKAVDYDTEIDKKEKDIETICYKLLLHQQPVAGDLRLITAALKMISDMERIGDQAADISELTIVMSQKPYIKNLEHIRSMAKETMLMVIDSLQAFIDKDIDKAQAVIDHDDIVDDLFCTVKGEIIDIIHKDPDDGDQATDLLMVAKYFERIGDHATNIAEWVIFSITGQR